MQLEDILDGDDYYDYLMATGFADEVLAERRMNRQKEAEAGSFREDMERRKEAKIASQLSGNGEDNLSLEDKEKIAESGRMAVEAYKKLDKEKVREDTEKYVNKTMEELKDIKRKRAGYSFDKIYYTQMIDGKEEKGTEFHEGGYSDNSYDLGGKTNYGITQDSLDDYRK